MGEADRRWWWYGAAAVLCAGTTVVFVIWYFVFVWPFDGQSGFRGQFDMGLAVACLAMLLLGIAALLVKMVARLQRESARALTIGGSANAMSEVDWPLGVRGDRPLTSTVSVEWPNTLAIRIGNVAGPLIAAAFVGASCVVIGIELLDYILRISGVDWPSLNQLATSLSGARQIQAPVHYPPLGALPIYGTALAFLVFQAVEWFMKRTPALVRISVDSTGLIARTRWGRRIFMPWHAVRLIELHGTPLQTPRTPHWKQGERYHSITVEVRDDHQLATWTVSPLMPRDRLERYTQLMTAVVRYTGREPHTFGLDSGQRALRGRMDLIARQLGAAIVVVVGASAGLTVGVFMPDGHFILLYTILVTAWGLWYIPRMGRPVLKMASPSVPTGTSSSVDIEPLWRPDPQALYEMTVGSYGLFRLSRIMCILLGGCVAVVAVAVTPDLVTKDQPGAWLSMVVALTGVLIVVVSVRARDTVVIAQQDGLRKRWVFGDTLIPWREIATMKQRANWYLVRDRGSRRRISWPTVPFDPAQTPQESGAILLNPQQMAAVVEQRTGLTLHDARPL